MSQSLGQRALRLRQLTTLTQVRLRRRSQLKKLLASARRVDVPCPICASSTVEMIFRRPEHDVQKFFCLSCEHLFTEFQQTELAHGQIVFRFDEPNEGRQTQQDLLREVAQASCLSAGTFLDFGVGGNIAAFQSVQHQMPQHRFMGCDIYPSTIPGYFKTYDAGAPTGGFDGISSYAVIEHLTNTLPAWTRLNQLLKPVEAGGGIMIHSFPSQWHLDFEDWAVQIAGHSCVFSRKSLKLICEAAGFEIVSADPPRFAGPHYHPVFVFRKSRDVA